MNWAHLHLIVNHAPVMGAFFSLSLLGWGMVRRSSDVQVAGLWSITFVGLAAALAYLSGNRAEKTLEGMPGLSDVLIGKHEDAALWALTAAIAAGAMAGVGLAMVHVRGHAPRWCLIVCLLLSILTCTVMARTANLGGQIRHEEARPGWVNPVEDGTPTRLPPAHPSQGG